MPSLPSKIVPTKVRCLKLSGELPVGLRIPPLELKILLESSPLKSRIFVRRLAVRSETLVELKVLNSSWSSLSPCSRSISSISVIVSCGISTIDTEIGIMSDSYG